MQVETANQTAKTVKKEGEKMRLTMLEAFQVLRGQKGSKLNTADDVALGVLIAVRDVKQTLEVSRKTESIAVDDEALRKKNGSLGNSLSCSQNFRPSPQRSKFYT